MTPDKSVVDERWRQIESVFFAAADLPPEQRAAFLDRTCAGDSELRREAESLFAGETQTHHNIAQVIRGAATSLFLESTMEGARFGPYRIEREIGRGGMGAVYLASRADAEFRRQVAIKLVKRGVDTDAVLKRFLQERQVLAGLDHPNIARLLDGGTSPDGRPWFALEYIEGQPIQNYCQTEELGIAELCELFRKVCEPVSYAHRNLVIHRDLKPANILVTPDGEPKLLDFGIARLLSLEPGENTIGLTLDNSRPLTPAYASPEQLDGKPVNTATDIFSLGAILFELLTGSAPVRNTTHGSGREIERPSAAARNPALRKTLDGDLDNIVQMATRAEPSRRYQSVDQLSEDVRRYLYGMPVLARDDTWSYRAGKFLRRNRLGMAGAAISIGLVAGGVTSVLWQARQTGIQRRRAEQRLGQLVELANRTLLNVHGSIERLPGGTEARREITRTTLEYLDKLNTESGNDSRVLLALASAYTRLAKIEGDPLQPNLGDLRGAEASYRKGTKIFASLLAADHSNSELQLRAAETSAGLGNVLAATGRSAEATAEYRRGLIETEAVLAGDAKNLPARKIAATLHIQMDAAALLVDDMSTRDDILRQVAVNTQLLAEYPQDTDCLLNLAQNYSQLGVIAGRAGHTRESLDYHEKSVSWREQAISLHPNDVAAQRELMMAYGHIGDMLGSPFLWSLGDSRGALDYYRKAAQIAQSMVLADPSDRQARIDLGIVLMRLGTVQDSPAQTAESLASLQKSEAILEPLLTSGTKNISYTRQLALLFEYKGRRLSAMGNYPAALQSYRRSLDICLSLLALRRDDLTILRQRLIDEGAMASLLARTADRATALGLAGEVLARAQTFVASRAGTERVLLPRAFDWYGDVFLTLARVREGPADQPMPDLKQAVGYYRQALREWSKLESDVTGHFTPEIKSIRAKLAKCEQALAR